MLSGRLRQLTSYVKWIVVAAIVAAVATYVLVGREPATYVATANAQVISGPQSAGQFEDQNSLLQLTNYYLAQAQTTPVAQASADALGRGTTAATVRKHVRVSALVDSQELQFSASSGSAAEAARWANSYATQFSARVASQLDTAKQDALNALQARITPVEQEVSRLPATSTLAASLTSQLQALQQQYSQTAAQHQDQINVIQPATVPTAPSSPKPKRDAALAALAVLLLASGAAYARVSFANRFATAEELAEATGLVALAEIPRLSITEPLAVEAFRSLRAAMEFLARDLESPSFVFTSAGAAAGKTHVVTNLAGVLAAGDLRVALVDADLRRPAVHERLGIDRTPGFADALLKLQGARLDHAKANGNGSHAPGGHVAAPSATVGSRRSFPTGEEGGLEVVPAGTPLPDPASVLATDVTGEVVAALRRAYDLVLIDSPPMLLADASVLARYTSGAVLVVDARHDRRSQVVGVIERLQSLEIPIVGFVFNGVAPPRRTDHYYRSSAVGMADGSEVAAR